MSEKDPEDNETIEIDAEDWYWISRTTEEARKALWKGHTGHAYAAIECVLNDHIDKYEPDPRGEE